MANTLTVTLETVAGDGLVFRADAPNGASLRMDTGADRQAPSPVETLLAALGGCAGMDVISTLRKKRQAVAGYEVVLHGERSPEYPRRFTRIEVVHRLRGRDLNATAIAEAIRLSDTKYCSVHASLVPGVEIVSRFEILRA